MPTPYALPPRRVLPPAPPPPLDLGSKVEQNDHAEDETRDTVLTAGLQSRIAALNLNHVGLNPSSRPPSMRKASRTSSILSSPSTSSLSSPSSFSTLSLSSTTSQSSLDSQSSTPAEVPRDQLKQLLARRPPVPPVPSARPRSMHVTASPAPSQLKASSRISLMQPLPPVVSTDRIAPVPPVLTESPIALSPSTPPTPIQRPSRPLPAPPPLPPSCIPANANQNSSLSGSKFVPGLSCLKCHDFSQVDSHARSFAQESVSLSDELVHALIEPFETETEKARALFAWFFHTVADEVKRIGTPDVDLTADVEEMKQVFVDICAQFADLFVDLARRAGLEAYFVWGYSKTNQLAPPSSSPDDEQPIPSYQNNDAWCCVMMDGEWHLIVPTWGRGFVSRTETETETIPSFVSRWFTSTPLEFRRTHFPEDANYQLVSNEDGGPISWETFITTQAGPSIDGEFYEHGLNPGTLQPREADLEGGQFYTFAISKSCEHLSTAYEDNYCFVIFSEALEAAVPLVHDEKDEECGWSVTIRVPAWSGGTIGLGVVWTVAGQDAKGLKPERFGQQEKIRKKACIRGLVQWGIV